AKRLEISQQANVRMLEAIRAEKNMLGATEDQLREYEETATRRRQDLSGLLDQGEGLASEEGKAAWRQLKTHLATMAQTQERIASLARAGDADAAFAMSS